MDCSCLVLRAAQIAGLPYYFKNTTTLVKNLNDVPENESLEEGDLIWFPGHVMIISDLEKHELVDAVSYSSGHGILRSTPLAGFFEGITTYDQLRSVGKEKGKLNLLNKERAVYKTVDQFRLLRM